jgi:hypothetical protein
MNVVGFQRSVSGDDSSAQAMGPGIGKKYAVMIGEEPPAVAEHAKSVIAYPVQQDYRRAVRLGWTEKPTAECRTILGRDTGITKINFIFDCV